MNFSDILSVIHDWLKDHEADTNAINSAYDEMTQFFAEHPKFCKEVMHRTHLIGRVILTTQQYAYVDLRTEESLIEVRYTNGIWIWNDWLTGDITPETVVPILNRQSESWEAFEAEIIEIFKQYGYTYCGDI